MRYYLQVSRVDTPSIPAKMVNLQALRNRAFIIFINPSMHIKYRLPPPTFVYPGIARLIYKRTPTPTTISVFLDLLKDSLRERAENVTLGWHDLSIYLSSIHVKP